MMDGYERKARQAEKDNDFGAAKVYWQLSQINAKSLARMSKPTKPKGFTKKTRARIEYLKSIKNDQNAQSQEELAALVSENKLRKSSLKYWKKIELENEHKILNL